MNILYVQMVADDGQYHLFASRDGTLVGSVAQEATRRDAQNIMLSLDDIVNAVGIALADYDAFVVVHGQGSYTSNRIGVVTVNTLAYTLKRPVLDVDMRVFEPHTPQEIINEVHRRIDKNGVPPIHKYIEPIYDSEPNIGSK